MSSYLNNHDSDVGQQLFVLLVAFMITVYATLAILWSKTAYYYAPALSTWRFLYRRHDFIIMHSERMLRFPIFNAFATVVRGEPARKAFLTHDASLDVTEGHALLQGPVSNLHSDTDTYTSKSRGFTKMVTALLNKTFLDASIPTLLQSLHLEMTASGNRGNFDLFDLFETLVFRMTLRLSSCAELMNDGALVQTLKGSFKEVERPPSILGCYLPWLPCDDAKRKKQIFGNMFSNFTKFVKQRVEAPETPDNGALNWFLSNGMGEVEIAESIIGVLFAGVPNTRVQASWIFVYMQIHEAWKIKVIGELRNAITKHSTLPASSPAHEQLSSIPLDAWETEIPSMDMIIRESLRLRLVGKLLRRNVGRDTMVDGISIKHGEFVVYDAHEVHMNPEIYTDPEMFDPGRFNKGRQEDQKVPLSFLGWGAGRHPCAGMRLAKLEIKILLAYVILAFDFDLTDAGGKPLISVPALNLNDAHQALPFEHERPLLKLKKQARSIGQSVNP